MPEKEHRKRIRERLGLKLPVKVHCRESLDFEWTEITRLIDVTPFGAGFTLKRPVEKGRLLHLTIPMPRQLRVFDHVEDQYRIWGLVRYLKSRPAESGKLPIFEVGVAFVGKRAPKSYEEDPAKRYEIAASVTEAIAAQDAQQILESLPATAGRDLREHTRHNIAVDMLLETIDKNGEIASSEHTVSENISRRGASLFTALEIPVGRFVRLTSGQSDIVVFAVVRSTNIGTGGIRRINVEFVDRDWPL
jgi:hypothetical protein